MEHRSCHCNLRSVRLENFSDQIDYMDYNRSTFTSHFLSENGQSDRIWVFHGAVNLDVWWDEDYLYWKVIGLHLYMPIIAIFYILYFSKPIFSELLDLHEETGYIDWNQKIFVECMAFSQKWWNNGQVMVKRETAILRIMHLWIHPFTYLHSFTLLWRVLLLGALALSASTFNIILHPTYVRILYLQFMNK